MGQLRIKANECNYQEHHGWLKEQFINGISDRTMISEIIKELTAVKTPVRLLVSRFMPGQEEWRPKIEKPC